ncbi:GNAT family N-acetyltransferase [Bacteriovorax sp. Seq25_V]|uniref:GNAT family N-acetyltransferase n=1 Tax=Bacteriovorax sp. Seq25_V TaxID=1201288 RepID=UPI00038A0B13|nr:GNAT family N-acetyltransferase [Bacteriovorax sp. Seq25_V]EQC47508.1 acetyltransferase, GNAT family [Bacteriovorax sp. Seq25_V]
MEIKKYLPKELKTAEVQELTEFLFVNLDEFRDSREDILECINYVDSSHYGGSIYLCREEGRLLGAVVVNNTGMKRFIPEHILVYIAVDENCRGKGIGGKLLSAVKEDLSGSIALHVEPHNPAKKLYEREGFTNKYLEMRFAQ